MDISSKRWRIRSAPGGGYAITCRDAPILYKWVRQVPSVSTIATMNEDAFDAWCARAIREEITNG